MGQKEKGTQVERIAKAWKPKGFGGDSGNRVDQCLLDKENQGKDWQGLVRTFRLNADWLWLLH